MVLFEDEDDFRFIMNLIAQVAALTPQLVIITFVIMKTHIHLVIEDPMGRAPYFFATLKRRLYRYYQSTGRAWNLDAFEPSLIPIEDLSTMRNTIVYVNRNGYLVNPNYTPYSYPWGANRFYFNLDACRRKDSLLGDMTYDEKRKLFRCSKVDCPETFTMIDGFISPVNYCDLKLGQTFYRDSHQYFMLISRCIEEYRDIARQLDDRFFCTDEEIWLCAKQLCKDKYGTFRPDTLTPEQKIELGKILYFDYKALDSQLQRIFRVKSEDVIKMLHR